MRRRIRFLLTLPLMVLVSAIMNKPLSDGALRSFMPLMLPARPATVKAVAMRPEESLNREENFEVMRILW
ncbi:MAG: hypothetical protein QG632_826 [Candidatus Dependentiae bacterium]|nr:hypothetical protein [Candidatus Dependentiae bacterium]